jgi:hypothetical protein
MGWTSDKVPSCPTAIFLASEIWCLLSMDGMLQHRDLGCTSNSHLTARSAWYLFPCEEA